MTQQEDAGQIPPGVVYIRRLGKDPFEDPLSTLGEKERVWGGTGASNVDCKHMVRILMDEEDRTLTCSHCGKQLDPFWLIKHWRELYRNQAYFVERINAHKKEEAERRQREKDRRDKRKGSSPEDPKMEAT